MLTRGEARIATSGSDFVFETFKDVFAVAITTLNKPLICRDLQPYARVTTCAAIACNAVCRDDADLWCVCCHVIAFGMGEFVWPVMANAGGAGKGAARMERLSA